MSQYFPAIRELFSEKKVEILTRGEVLKMLQEKFPGKTSTAYRSALSNGVAEGRLRIAERGSLALVKGGLKDADAARVVQPQKSVVPSEPPTKPDTSPVPCVHKHEAYFVRAIHAMLESGGGKMTHAEVVVGCMETLDTMVRRGELRVSSDGVLSGGVAKKTSAPVVVSVPAPASVPVPVAPVLLPPPSQELVIVKPEVAPEAVVVVPAPAPVPPRMVKLTKYEQMMHEAARSTRRGTATGQFLNNVSIKKGVPAGLIGTVLNSLCAKGVLAWDKENKAYVLNDAVSVPNTAVTEEQQKRRVAPPAAPVIPVTNPLHDALVAYLESRDGQAPFPVIVEAMVAGGHVRNDGERSQHVARALQFSSGDKKTKRFESVKDGNGSWRLIGYKPADKKAVVIPVLAPVQPEEKSDSKPGRKKSADWISHPSVISLGSYLAKYNGEIVTFKEIAQHLEFAGATKIDGGAPANVVNKFVYRGLLVGAPAGSGKYEIKMTQLRELFVA